MNLARTAVVLLASALVALTACSSKTSSSEDSAKRHAPDDEARSADAILQARLQQAVRDIDKREARRGPDALFLRTGLGSAGDAASGMPSAAAPGPAEPHVKLGSSSVAGRLPPEVVQRVIRASFAKFRACYQTALRTDPNLTGQVSVAFTIGRDGSVGDVKETTEIADKAFAACLRSAFSTLSFPQPDGGVVRVTYPLRFAPGDVAPNSSANANAPLPGDDSPSAEPMAKKKPADPKGPWPIVVVDKDLFRLDGESMGSPKALIESGKPGKVDDLFTAMKKRREDWKAANPDTAFPGVVGLRVDADVPTVAFKSVFQTLAYTGYPYVFVQSASDPEHIVEVAAQVPGPPDFETRPQPPVLDLHVFVTPSEAELSWRQGEVMPELPRKVPVDAALAGVVCDSWKQKGSHRDAADERQDRFVLHADNTVPFEQVEKVTRAVLACARAHEGAPAPIPAFWFQLAMR